MKRLRGVSEIVSVLLLLLIVSAVGFAIYMAFLSQTVAMSRAAERSVEEAKASALAGAYIAEGYVYVNQTRGCGELRLFLVASERPLDVRSIYLDDMIVYPNVTGNTVGCTVSAPPPTIHLVPGYLNYTVVPLPVDMLSYLLERKPTSVTVKITTRYNVDVGEVTVVIVA